MLTIRLCEEKDLDRVFELLRQLWPEWREDAARSREAFLRGLRDDSQRYMCALLDGELVGFCSLSVKNSMWVQGFLGYIDELVVDEGVRGRGIGAEMLQRAIELAREMGCRHVELDSAFHREEAHRFYERQGFDSRALLFIKEI